jgi:hypothetical protein
MGRLAWPESVSRCNVPTYLAGLSGRKTALSSRHGRRMSVDAEYSLTFSLRGNTSSIIDLLLAELWLPRLAPRLTNFPFKYVVITIHRASALWNFNML